MSQVVQLNGHFLQFASNRLKGDKELVQKAVESDNSAWAYASDNLKNDEAFVLKLLRQFKKKEIGDPLAENAYDKKTFILHGYKLKDNVSFMMSAIALYPYLGALASERVKADPVYRTYLETKKQHVTDFREVSEADIDDLTLGASELGL